MVGGGWPVLPGPRPSLTTGSGPGGAYARPLSYDRSPGLGAGRALPDSALRLAASRVDSICVCIPARNEAAAIGPICRSLVALRGAGAIDRVLVLDDSSDATATVAATAGADVIAQAALLPEFGPVQGKGDAMWRALDACEEDVIVYVDGDTSAFDPRLASDLAAAIALDGAAFAKATYRRPWRTAEGTDPTGGGRVTELTAKPLLAALFPELGRFNQPLAGEIAARTATLRQLAFVTGYGVDVALLIDTYRRCGPDGLVEIDTGVRQNRHRPLGELAVMAGEVAGAILGRAGIAAEGGSAVERPPMELVRALAGRHAEAA